MKSKNTMKIWVIGQSLLLALGIAGAAHAAGKGPQLSVDVAAYCGNNGDMLYDTDGVTLLHQFDDDNVVIFYTDESDDPDDENPLNAEVPELTIECLEQTDKGKMGYEDTGQTIILDQGFGQKETKCNVDPGTEWKATVTASGVDLRKDVSDTCDEVIAY